MTLGDIVKGFVNIVTGKKKHDLERLKDFYDKYLGCREDYKLYLVDLIKQANTFGGYEEDDPTGNDSGIFRVNENIKRLDYLKDIEVKLIEEELNLNGTKIGTLYQLITVLQTQSGRLRKINKKMPKKGFKGIVYL